MAAVMTTTMMTTSPASHGPVNMEGRLRVCKVGELGSSRWPDPFGGSRVSVSLWHFCPLLGAGDFLEKLPLRSAELSPLGGGVETQRKRKWAPLSDSSGRSPTECVLSSKEMLCVCLLANYGFLISCI